MKTLLLMIGHGSRDASANEEFEQLVAAYQRRRPDFEVRFGYLELAEPSLTAALASLDNSSCEVVILPLFLFAAGHVKKDVPAAIAKAQHDAPGLQFRVARELGIHPTLVDAALSRAESVISLDREATARTTVVMVGRGSSDPEAIDDFNKISQLLKEAGNFERVLPCFVSVAKPRFEETLELAAQLHPERLLVLPYFLFRGQLVTQIGQQVAEFQTRYPQIEIVVVPHLGVSEHLLTVMDERIEEALNKNAPSARGKQFIHDVGKSVS